MCTVTVKPRADGVPLLEPNSEPATLQRESGRPGSDLVRDGGEIDPATPRLGGRVAQWSCDQATIRHMLKGCNRIMLICIYSLNSFLTTSRQHVT